MYITDKLIFQILEKLKFKKLKGDTHEINPYIQFTSKIQFVIFLLSLFSPLQLVESQSPKHPSSNFGVIFNTSSLFPTCNQSLYPK